MREERSHWRALRQNIFILISLLGCLAPWVTTRLFSTESMPFTHWGKMAERPGGNPRTVSSDLDRAELRTPHQLVEQDSSQDIRPNSSRLKRESENIPQQLAGQAPLSVEAQSQSKAQCENQVEAIFPYQAPRPNASRVPNARK